jgi:ADP-heptose:LPS heptosyltransferase
MIRVLALVPGGIGDQILFFPTLDDLKRHYPQAKVDVIVEPQAKSAYQVCKSVQEVITFDFKNRNSLADWGNLLGKMREREYDIGLSLGQHWTLDALLWLAGIPTRSGYGKNSISKFFLTNPVLLKTEQYAAHMYHDLLQGLGITTPCPELTINVPKRAIEWAEAEQKQLGLLGPQGSNYVLIHQGSSQLARKEVDTYPVENWQKIIQDFQRRQPDLPVVVIQDPEDQEWVAALKQVDPDLKVTAPGDIGKLAAMIAGASLMVCTDSAPMHLAVAVKTYLIALFGPTDPAKFLPASDRVGEAFPKGIASLQENRFIGIKSPTGRMADISPGVVLERIWGA